MSARLSPATIACLTLPPLLWAGNAVAGRMLAPYVPPMMLNLLRWAGAFVLLLPLAAWVLRPGSGLARDWRRFTLLGLLGVGCYNALQYLALKTSSPINVTLVASSTPIFMLLVGHVSFGQRTTGRQWAGAALSVAGVAVVLAQGDPRHLAHLRLVPGDLYVLLATFAWAWYSWLLTRRDETPAIRNDWAAFVMAQTVYGLGWCSLFAGGEWLVTQATIQWGWELALGLLYISVGPAVLAYRFWGLGIQRAGPAVAGFFSNLTPLFAALLSAALIGETPQAYHALAFMLIVGGIAWSSRTVPAGPPPTDSTR